jgi:hypothetical protein
VKDGRNTMEYQINREIVRLFEESTTDQKRKYAAQLRCIKVGGELFTNQYPKDG